MSKKHVVKRKINKKNTFILLTLTVLITILLIGFIKSLFKEDDVLAKESNSNLVTESSDNLVTESTNNSATESNNTDKEEPISSEDSDEDVKKTHFKVVVDASYGGSDGGSKGYNGIIQKNVNLEIALKVKSVLERFDDIDVILTRDSDNTVSMAERADIINNSNADFVVSIMQNTEGTGKASGVESYVLPKENEKSNTKLGYILQQAMTMYIDTDDRGVLARNMDILLRSDIPGVVVNTGFISNKEEGLNLSSEEYQLRMAEGISQGILSYIDRYLKE